MSISLSKDADKAICAIYQAYLEKRKNGESRADAKCFGAPIEFPLHSKLGWSMDDFTDTLYELSDAGLLSVSVIDSYEMTNEAIIYMENRFKNGINELTDFIAKFIP